MKKILTRYIKIKIIVIFIAIFIWFFVETENNYTYSFDIPISVSNLSAGKIITNRLPKNVKITLWGKGRDLLALILNQRLNYDIDLTNVNESKLFILRKSDVRFSRITNVEVLNIVEPDSIYVDIENLLEKKIIIEPHIVINTIPGYTIVGGIQLEPDSATVISAKSSLDSMLTIKTDRVIYDNTRRRLYKKVKLIEPNVKNVWLCDNEVHFYADVQKLMEKPLIEIPVLVRNKPPNLDLVVIPSSLSLTLIGGVDLLLPITKNDITAYLDYNKIQHSTETYHRAYIEKPDGIRIKDVKPKYFKVIFKKYH